MRYIVTGCAGFIGSTLTDRLLQDGHEVIGVDNFSTGLPEFLTEAKKHANFTLHEIDLLDRDTVKKAFMPAEAVFHMAANADVRFGTDHPHKDLEQNAIATFHVLEAMRDKNIKRIAFASTGSVYGEAPVIPTPELAPFPVQTSLYGASKLAAEGLIQAYAEGFDFQGYIFRFVSILGERYTHGHVFDFYKQLLQDPERLFVLGNGKQRKSYLYVQDCINAILHAMDTSKNKVNIFNLGTDEYCEVNDSIGWICDYLKLTPQREYAGGERGWIGDNPFIFLDTARIRNLGWKPKLTIQEGIKQTIKYLHENPWDSGAPFMKIGVLGCWHLGCVTAACLAELGHQVLGFDPTPKIIQALNVGKAPLFEPGLDDLIAKNLAKHTLSFSQQLADLADSDVVWVTFDTPVNDDDEADVDFVITQIKALLPLLKENTHILISSQLPVGTTRQLMQWSIDHCPGRTLQFAYSPENLRLGQAIHIFIHPDRIIVGVPASSPEPVLAALLSSLSTHIIWMSVESAEMTKHALNAFLATSVVFINEIAAICEQVGADAAEVECGLKTEERIGPKAYLRAGGPIAGGTLMRDIQFLLQTSKTHALSSPFISAIKESNSVHKQWACRRITQVLQSLPNKTIAALGLTYKVGTDTLRRSEVIATCEWLCSQGARIVAFDPVVKELPEALQSFIELKPTAYAAMAAADAVLIGTPWPEFLTLSADNVFAQVKKPAVFDAGGFLAKLFRADTRFSYYSVGR